MQRQRQFDFTPGLTEQFKSFEDVVLATVRNGGVKQGTIAGKCDVSPSEFSKSLNRYEDRRLDMGWLENIVDETGDFRPIYYLMEKYLESPDSKRQRAVDLLTQMLPLIREAAETLKSEAKK